jgi:hypothetical protein
MDKILERLLMGSLLYYYSFKKFPKGFIPSFNLLQKKCPFRRRGINN